MKKAVTVIVEADNDMHALRVAAAALADFGAACEAVARGEIVVARKVTRKAAEDDGDLAPGKLGK